MNNLQGCARYDLRQARELGCTNVGQKLRLWARQTAPRTWVYTLETAEASPVQLGRCGAVEMRRLLVDISTASLRLAA